MRHKSELDTKNAFTISYIKKSFISKIWLNMKFRNVFLLTLISAAALVAAYCPQPQAVDKEQLILQVALSSLKQVHFAPKKIDDEFSKNVYKLYLDRLDGTRDFLTQKDIEQLQPFETQIDNQISGSDLSFFNKSLTITDAAIARAEAMYTEILTKPIDFSKNESLELDREKKSFAKSDKDLKESWRKNFKYQVMSRLATKLEEKETGKADFKDKSEEDLKATALADATKTYNDYFKRVKKVKRSERFAAFVSTITNVYDPHTEYFEPIEKQNFDIGMSGRLIGIGARLQSDPETDFVKVLEIVIGGPAWKQKDLQEGDVIMKVAQAEKEPVDVAGMSIDEVVSMIRGKLGAEVRLTVRKKVDGSTKVINIIREEVLSDEGFAKSLILQTNDKTEQIGYIKLPKFYADFEREEGRRCADDVATEIKKLKAAQVKGIILDLRFNGGGSLSDVVKMSGFFVESGPMVQVKNNDSSIDVSPDPDPSVLYDGPLVIMVNQYSASASEIIAAAMQDYKRAVIVGATTYGKGTVQRFFGLDRINGYDQFKPLGDVKITIQKFYRINGGSTQLRGVTPDIILPDRFSKVEMGEREQDFPMAWTSVNPVAYKQSVVDLKDMPKIIERSRIRVSQNPTFKLIEENSVSLKEQRDQSTVSLNLKAFRGEESKRKEFNKKFEGITKTIDGFVANNLDTDMKFMQNAGDSSKIARNTEWVKDIKKDIQLYETLSIVKDIIETATFKTAAVNPKKD
jgi:carboxyl-terminal processing protease